MEQFACGMLSSVISSSGFALRSVFKSGSFCFECTGGHTDSVTSLIALGSEVWSSGKDGRVCVWNADVCASHAKLKLLFFYSQVYCSARSNYQGHQFQSLPRAPAPRWFPPLRVSRCLLWRLTHGVFARMALYDYGCLSSVHLDAPRMESCRQSVPPQRALLAVPSCGAHLTPGEEMARLPSCGPAPQTVQSTCGVRMSATGTWKKTRTRVCEWRTANSAAVGDHPGGVGGKVRTFNSRRCRCPTGMLTPNFVCFTPSHPLRVLWASLLRRSHPRCSQPQPTLVGRLEGGHLSAVRHICPAPAGGVSTDSNAGGPWPGLRRAFRIPCSSLALIGVMLLGRTTNSTGTGRSFF